MRRTLRSLAVCGLVPLVAFAGCSPPDVAGRNSASPSSAGGFPCPPVDRSASATPLPPAGDGRVRVGRVSYPAAPAPYAPPSSTVYMAFGSLSAGQSAVVEMATASSLGWNSVVALARLSSVDGAWGTQQAAEVVGQCSLSMTWLGIDYHPQPRRDEAVTVDGHPGWIRVTDLSFAVPGIRATREVQTVVTLDAGGETYAYLSYLPDTADQLKASLDATREGLRVD